MTKCALLYARTNDHGQAKLVEQLQTCREYAQGHNWHAVAEVWDQGVRAMGSCPAPHPIRDGRIERIDSNKSGGETSPAQLKADERKQQQ
jgi:hypothetical protein